MTNHTVQCEKCHKLIGFSTVVQGEIIHGKIFEFFCVYCVDITPKES